MKNNSISVKFENVVIEVTHLIRGSPYKTPDFSRNPTTCVERRTYRTSGKLDYVQALEDAGRAAVLTNRTFLSESEADWKTMKSDTRKLEWLNLRRLVARYDWSDWVKMQGDVFSAFCTDLVIMSVYKHLFCDEPICIHSYVTPDESKYLKVGIKHGLFLNPKAGPDTMSKVLKEMGLKNSTRQAMGCNFCGEVTGNLKKCSACKKASYCSVACQKKHWQYHKHTCEKPKQTSIESTNNALCARDTVCISSM